MTKTTTGIIWAALALGNLGIAAGMRIEGHTWWALGFAAVALGFAYHAFPKPNSGVDSKPKNREREKQS